MDHLIAERIAYATNQASYEPVKFDTCLVQNIENSDSIDIDTGLPQNYDPGWARDSQKITEVIDLIEMSGDSEGEVQSLSTDESRTVDSQDELDLWEPEHIPHTVIRFAKGQILEEFMLEEEIKFQGLDKCKIVQLPDEQEINECAVSELIGNADLLVRFIEKQETEESIKEEVSNIILPKCIQQKKVYKKIK